MSDEKKMILKMVEDGKISVEEAERLLKAVGEKEALKDEEPVSSLSTYIDMESKKEKTESYKQSSSVSKVTQFLGSLVQKIKDVDLDFNFGPSEAVNHIFHQEVKDLQDLHVSLKNGDVHFVPWEQAHVQIDCKAKVYKVTNSKEARQKFLREAVVSVKNNSLSFICHEAEIKAAATIFIPMKVYETIAVKMFNGHVSGKNMNVEKLKIKTVNGNLAFTNIKSHEGNFETANGALEVEDSVFHKVELETVNGAIKAAGCFKEIEAESLNGAIIIEMKHDGIVNVKSMTGSVNVCVPEKFRVDGELKSAVGALSCELSSFEIEEEKKEMAARFLKFYANKEFEKQITITANSKAGSISVKNLY
ncbi:DUF4097 family beta strand repeat-containing protein [Bacillus taeanensis]|uniref:DUF4097 domain-containing protein n=1 Tax=Bacillus taeanensis TaxID=273032 RepID=A0A366Y1D6_9BACI|nr:DUF4097 domain-containing protein [Bacillus taeanensis]RBW71185.1 DUF4097 domain-containing protein [Bacillus taeanensis]